MPVKSTFLQDAFLNAFKNDAQYQALCAVHGYELPIEVYDEFVYSGANLDGTVVFQATVQFEGREYSAAMSFYQSALPIEVLNSIGAKVDTKELLCSIFNSVVQKPF